MKVAPYIPVFFLCAVVLFYFTGRLKYPQRQLQAPIKSTSEFIVFTLAGSDSVTNRRINLYYHDSVAHGHPIFINRHGTRVQTSAPAFFFMSNAAQTPYFVYPGEHINIRATSSDSITMDITANQVRSNELNFFSRLVRETGNIYCAYTFMPYHKKVRSVSEVQAAAQTINGVKERRLAFLSAYTKTAPLSRAFTGMAISTIQITAFTDSLLLYYNNRGALRQQHLYHSLLEENISNLQRISASPNQVYYKACSMLVSLCLGNAPDYFVQNTIDLRKRFGFIKNNFSGITRDFLMAHTLSTAHDNSIQVDAAYLQQFKQLCTDSGYKHIIERTFHSKTDVGAAAGTNLLLATDGVSKQEIQSFIAHQKGKLLLLDFWASWCGPCREENPHIKSLEKFYKNRSIAFVRISTDQKTEDWLRAVKEESMDHNNSFLLINANQSTFIKRHRINTIPRYLLFGKDGHMISEDAPRPSDPLLIKLIDKHL
jgi:thiol-disulfide isomerase/thioredoxin